MVAQKMLETWKSAARDQCKQANELEDKSNECAQIMMASPVTHINNWPAYHTIYLPRMTFPLPLQKSYLSERQLHKIKKRAIGATPCKGGFVSTFPRQVAFGPLRYGGIASASASSHETAAMPRRKSQHDTDHSGVDSVRNRDELSPSRMARERSSPPRMQVGSINTHGIILNWSKNRMHRRLCLQTSKDRR
jgi:hypothetical protein